MKSQAYSTWANIQGCHRITVYKAKNIKNVYINKPSPPAATWRYNKYASNIKNWKNWAMKLIALRTGHSPGFCILAE